MNEKKSLLTLPLDVLLWIFAFLSPREMGNCLRVCRKLHNYKTQIFWYTSLSISQPDEISFLNQQKFLKHADFWHCSYLLNRVVQLPRSVRCFSSSLNYCQINLNRTHSQLKYLYLEKSSFRGDWSWFPSLESLCIFNYDENDINLSGLDQCKQLKEVTIISPTLMILDNYFQNLENLLYLCITGFIIDGWKVNAPRLQKIIAKNPPRNLFSLPFCTFYTYREGEQLP